jgi:biopolymer transport protein ExbD
MTCPTAEQKHENMSKFATKRGRPEPSISTASLPDIIFILLFFFMVVTKMRESELKVTVVTPFASELTKLEEKSLVATINIGRPSQKYRPIYGTKPQIQLNDKFARVGGEESEIRYFMENFRTKVPESRRQQITASLRVDGGVTMGIVADVKTALRKSAQLKVNYSAKRRPNASY